jgi:hypothetical protein
MDPRPAAEGARMLPEYGLPEFHVSSSPTKRTMEKKKEKKKKTPVRNLNPREETQKKKKKKKKKKRTGLQSIILARALALVQAELVTDREAIVELGRATDDKATLNIAGRSEALEGDDVEGRDVEARSGERDGRGLRRRRRGRRRLNGRGGLCRWRGRGRCGGVDICRRRRLNRL